MTMNLTKQYQNSTKQICPTVYNLQLQYANIMTCDLDQPFFRKTCWSLNLRLNEKKSNGGGELARALGTNKKLLLLELASLAS